jgi:hypothetical protein
VRRCQRRGYFSVFGAVGRWGAGALERAGAFLEHWSVGAFWSVGSGAYRSEIINADTPLMDGQSNCGQSDGIDGFGALIVSGKGVKNSGEGIPNQVSVFARTRGRYWQRRVVKE